MQRSCGQNCTLTLSHPFPRSSGLRLLPEPGLGRPDLEEVNHGMVSPQVRYCWGSGSGIWGVLPDIKKMDQGQAGATEVETRRAGEAWETKKIEGLKRLCCREDRLSLVTKLLECCGPCNPHTLPSTPPLFFLFFSRGITSPVEGRTQSLVLSGLTDRRDQRRPDRPSWSLRSTSVPGMRQRAPWPAVWLGPGWVAQLGPCSCSAWAPCPAPPLFLWLRI